MQAKLIALYLKHTSNDKGFTLIELLVVLIIIGILSAIALPSFLGQANRARQAEANSNLGAINRAQQVYFLEQGKFVTNNEDFGLLGVGVPLETANYDYLLAPTESGTGVVAIANPKGPFKAFAYGQGLVYQSAVAVEPATLTAACESTAVDVTLGASAIALTVGTPGVGGGAVSCAGNTQPVGGK